MKKVPNGHISSKIPSGPMLNINKPCDDPLEKRHGKCLIFFKSLIIILIVEIQV